MQDGDERLRMKTEEYYKHLAVAEFGLAEVEKEVESLLDFAAQQNLMDRREVMNNRYRMAWEELTARRAQAKRDAVRIADAVDEAWEKNYERRN